MTKYRWTTLEHQGVLFPDKYKPHHINLKYNGKAIKLLPESEEVATFYAAMLHTEYVKNPIFNKNFFSDFKEILKEYDPKANAIIKNLESCDFTDIARYLEEIKMKNQRKKKRNSNSKKNKMQRNMHLRK